MKNTLYSRLMTGISNIKVGLANQLEKTIRQHYHPAAKFELYIDNIKQRLDKENVAYEHLHIEDQKGSLWYLNTLKD